VKSIGRNDTARSTILHGAVSSHDLWFESAEVDVDLVPTEPIRDVAATDEQMYPVTSLAAPSQLAPTDSRSNDASNVNNPPRLAEFVSFKQAETWEEVEAMLRQAQMLSQGEANDPLYGTDETDLPSQKYSAERHNAEQEPAEFTGEVRQKSVINENRELRTIMPDAVETKRAPHSNESKHASFNDMARRLADDPISAEVKTLVLRPFHSSVEIMLKLSDLPNWVGVQPFYLHPCAENPHSLLMAPLKFDSAGLRSGKAVWIKFKNLAPATDCGRY
jgi:hypothetical protein